MRTEAAEPNYPDNGCGVEPSCLNCSLPQCLEEVTEIRRTTSEQRAERTKAILNCYGTMSQSQIVRRLGLHPSVVKGTIHRHLKKQKGAQVG